MKIASNSLSLLRRIQIVGQSHYILYSNTNREMSGCDELIRDEKQNESIIEGTGRVQWGLGEQIFPQDRSAFVMWAGDRMKMNYTHIK